MSDEQVEKVIYDVTMGYISIEEAARRMDILENEPEHYTCSMCRKFRANLCVRPGHPIRPEHPDSARCEDYERRDLRDEAMPLERPKNRSKMFK